MKELPQFFIGFRNDEALNEILKKDDLELFTKFIESKIKEVVEE